jgi:hypothetical protein
MTAMNETLPSPGILEFEIAFEQRYARVWFNDFKEAFLEIGVLIKSGGFEKFIFDKRALRAFHQPTMEWYFIHWKKEMLGYGVKTHRKILPEEKWFEKMVQLAKAQILADHPDHIIDQLDIAYCDTLEAAILT